jgi:hypothetical protein
VFKYQVNEFDQNQRIGQLEERLERQQDEINRQANACEQIRVQRQTIVHQYDQRMHDIETALKAIIQSMSEEKGVSLSFCEGAATDHPGPVVIQNVRNKYIINNHSMFPIQKMQQPNVGGKKTN